MDAAALEFLKALSESFGPSGFERETVRAVKQYVAPFADSLSSDKLGSLHFRKKGKADKPVIVLPGHVDEVGFVISGINDKGYLTFNPLGGWFDQVLLGQRVKVRTSGGSVVRGVIAAKPPHVMPPEERAKVVTKDKMFIDVGCSNEKEAKEMGIRIGDPAAPDSSFSTMEKTVFRKPEGGGEEKKAGKTTIACGKGFDDRVGAFVACEAIRRLKEERLDHPNTVVGIATVQEEVGLRGARTSAHLAQPDVCITLEVDIAGDVPGIEPHEAPARMGLGPSIITYDASMIPNQALKDLVVRTAEERKIPYQLSQTRGGGTDAGAIHVSNAGCPSIVISVPTRHIHSHVGLISLEDIENCMPAIASLEDLKEVQGRLEKLKESFPEAYEEVSALLRAFRKVGYKNICKLLLGESTPEKLKGEQ
jgi:putative aminopeptidase FrvX